MSIIILIFLMVIDYVTIFDQIIDMPPCVA